VLRRDPRNTEAAATLGIISLVYDWDWEAARERLEQAVQADPSSQYASFFYGWYLIILRDYERGLAQVKRALERDPLSAFANGSLGWFYLYAGRPAEAAEVLERVTTPDQMSPMAWSAMALVLAQVDRTADAEKALRRARQIAPAGANVVVDCWVVNALVVLGRRAEGEGILAQWLEREKNEYVDPQFLAAMAAALGKKELALDLLDRAFAARSPTLVRISADTWSFRQLSDEPRFLELLRRMQYPPLPANPYAR
jgi:tetratricopeptide (TPR) repeat protein